MWKRNKGLALSALSALLALGCGGEAVDVGHNGGSRWTDAATSTGAAAEPQTIYEGAEPIYGFVLDGPTLYALVDHQQSIELIACPLTRCRSERTTLYSRPLADNEGTQPTPLVLGAGQLYWVDAAAHRRIVVACPTTGCSEPQVLATEWDRGLAADDEGAYWFNDEHRLVRQARDAEAPTPVQDEQWGQSTSGLMARGDDIYFVVSDRDASSIRRVKKDGTSASEEVVSDQIISGFSFATDVLYYLSRVLTGRVAACSPEGCEAGGSTLAANQRWPGAIRVEGNEVFWLNNTQWSYDTGKTTLVSCLLPNCETQRIRAVEFTQPFGIDEVGSFAVNQESIVWLEAVQGLGTRLRRVAR